jgi:hypothetical protein
MMLMRLFSECRAGAVPVKPSFTWALLFPAWHRRQVMHGLKGFHFPGTNVTYVAPAHAEMQWFLLHRFR